MLLSGTKVLRQHSDARLPFDDVFVEAKLIGEEQQLGLQCFKVSVERGRDINGEHKVTGLRYFWLAKDRNLLPVRFEGYVVKVSREIPLSIGMMSDLREVKPGVWLPFQFKHEAIGMLDLWEHGEMNAHYEEEYRVLDAAVDIDYPREFFQKVEFPPGIPIYRD